ncbi:MAG TPA: thiol:disulfide interchange protein DsbA/DsbL [Steroidobacteraceae bacterium]|jgi:thiol:disulfide interchange protein DsbA|nr:thiol:disulfide interchange protein DsbA/DsbL [Steroidobacteraceae bacterium]
MNRWLALAAVVALSVAACSRQGVPPPPSAPPAASAPGVLAPPTPATPPPAANTPSLSEIEQARASQESADGAAGEKTESSDASLERMAALPPDAQLPSGRWKAGVNYDPVVPAQPTSVESGKVEVIEVMWLGCPHCYELEPYVRAWLKTKPPWIEFSRVPVMWQGPQQAHAKLFYTLKALGRADLIDKAFDTIQQQHNPLIADSDQESLKIAQAWAAQQGISAQDFASAFNSFSVNSDLQRAEELTTRYRVQFVPTFVINGKYTTDVGKAGGPTQIIQLVNDLAAYEHRR